VKIDGNYLKLEAEFKKRVKDFMAKSVRKMNFRIWNEVVFGYVRILSQQCPPCLNKYLIEQYDYYLVKYAKSRIKEGRKHYERKNNKDKARSRPGVFNTNGGVDLTEEELIEINKSHFLDLL